MTPISTRHKTLRLWSPIALLTLAMTSPLPALAAKGGGGKPAAS
jgi:hypothetical protein